ncbi:hypothetical protein [Wolbachia endosymbiont of Dactylopius coccus]
MYNTEIKIPVLPFLSSQCLTLGSSFSYNFVKIYCASKFTSVTRWSVRHLRVG